MQNGNSSRAIFLEKCLSSNTSCFLLFKSVWFLPNKKPDSEIVHGYNNFKLWFKIKRDSYHREILDFDLSSVSACFIWWRCERSMFKVEEEYVSEYLNVILETNCLSNPFFPSHIVVGFFGWARSDSTFPLFLQWSMALWLSSDQ